MASHEVTHVKRLMTVSEVAGALSMSRSTVYRLIDDGRLDVLHLGRAARIRSEDVDRLIDGIAATPKTE